MINCACDNAVREIRHAVIDRANFACRIQARLPPANADDLLREPPLAQRKSNRATNQSHADNGYRVVLGHVGILNVRSQVGEGAIAAANDST